MLLRHVRGRALLRPAATALLAVEASYTIEIIGLADPGPYLTIAVSCGRCRQRITTDDFDVRDYPNGIDEVVGELIGEAATRAGLEAIEHRCEEVGPLNPDAPILHEGAVFSDRPDTVHVARILDEGGA